MDTSMKAAMSSKADGLLRAIEIAEKWMDPSNGMQDTLKAEEAEIDLSKDQIKEFILRFLQVKSVDVDQLSRAGFEKAADIRQAFWEHMNKILSVLSTRITKVKTDLRKLSEYEPVMEAVQTMDEKAIAEFASKPDNDSNVQAFVSGSTVFSPQQH